MSANLLHRFLNRCADTGAKRFLTDPDGSGWRFQALFGLAGQMAGDMIERGIAPGDRVVAQVDKSPAAVALYLACLQCGAVFVPLNVAYTAHEVEYFLTDSDASLFVHRPEASRELVDRAAAIGVAAVCLGTSRTTHWWAQVEQLDPCTDVVARAGSDIASIIYTSGTTGRSKGAMLSHDNLASNAVALHRLWGFRSDDVLLHALPIFHVHGLFVALHCALLSASEVIFLARFDIDEICRQMPRSTILMGVPTFYTRLLGHATFGADMCRNMRLFISGSAPLTEATFDAFEQRTGHRILERYGMSECGMIASNPLHGKRVAGTVGFALPEVMLRVVDAHGSRLPAGESGVGEGRGPNLFQGYWRMPEKTAGEIREDGFFTTGDLGTLADDGRLTIVGRARDLIISAGYNIYPKEVECCLNEIDGIRESAVIGVPHPDLGEAAIAVVVAKPGASVAIESVRAALATELAHFKYPRALRSVDALPRNAMGKVQKNVLRERYADMFLPAGGQAGRY